MNNKHKILTQIKDFIECDSSKMWFFTIAIALMVMSIRYFLPQLISNEMVYLITPRRLIDYSYLSSDWAWGEFKIPMAPLYALYCSFFWLISSDYVVVALLTRFLLWILLLYSIYSVAHQLKISPFFTLFGIFLYCYTFQKIAAGEWIVGGGEQKVLAYSLLFLALSSLLQNKIVVSGIYSGLASLSHILVGGYGIIAIFITLIILYFFKHYSFKNILHYFLSIIPFCLPALFIAISHLFTPGQTNNIPVNSIDINKLIVTFRNPHHLDPFYFFTQKRVVVLIVFSFSLCIALFQIEDQKKRNILLLFLGVLFSFFMLGCLCRYINLFLILKYFPFRVADTLIPFFFWLVIPTYAYKNLIKGSQLFSLRFHNIFSLLLICLIARYLITTTIPNFINASKTFSNSWYNLISKSESESETTRKKVVSWIKEQTNTSDVFIANPFWYSFWLETDRPMVLNFKDSPYNLRFANWYFRLKALNNDKEFEKSGYYIIENVNKNFNELSTKQLQKILNLFNGRYYIVDKDREDLSNLLVYNNDKYWIYDVNLLNELE